MNEHEHVRCTSMCGAACLKPPKKRCDELCHRHSLTSGVCVCFCMCFLLLLGWSCLVSAAGSFCLFLLLLPRLLDPMGVLFFWGLIFGEALVCPTSLFII